jgi:hypothetical protein
MSKKMKNEHNPFLMVIYIAAVAAVIAGLFFMYRHSAKREEEYQALVEELKRTEDPKLEQNSWVTAEEKIEEAGEEEDGAEADAHESAPAEQPGEEASETPAPEDTGTAVSPTATPSAPADPNLSVVVLNGTGKEGVAAQWTEALRNGGYTNVTPATYSGAVEEQTLIYAASEEQGAQFLNLFPNGIIRIGTVDAQGIITGAGVNLPAQVDVYIVVGKNETIG